MAPQAPDFARLFTDGSEHDLGPGPDSGRWIATVRVITVAQLQLPTGRLMAFEPFALLDETPFTQEVKPGAYPVQLIMADHRYEGPGDVTGFAEVAAARVVVRDEPVARWRLALLEGQDDAELDDEDDYFGYPVDGGTGSFGSPEVFRIIDERGSDALLDVTQFEDEEYETGYKVHTEEATGENLVVFRTGGGDGVYPTWVGHTADDEVACFVTDFFTLTDEDD